MKPRFCELCTEEASLYCESDSAFLCWNCDSKVHGANFLVARHIRRTICSKCKGFDGNCMSGLGLRPFRPICLSCSSGSDEEGVDSLSSASSSSDCISTAESFTIYEPKIKKINFDRKKSTKITCSSSVTDISGETSSFPVNFTGEESLKKMKTDRTRKFRDLSDVDRKVDGVLVNSCKKLGEEPFKKMKIDGKKRFKGLTNVDSKSEGIVVNWCNKLGLKNGCSVLPLASYALRVCSQKLTFLPFRVAVASSFWFSLKFLGGLAGSTCQNLKRFEEISGVPVKLIILAESKISRVLNLNRRSKLDLVEGWAECSG